MLTYGSVCSGIEAASVAWECLGFKPLWFSEIEPFPCAVLAHHWPDIPNHGDMAIMADRILNREIPAPDILVGGTPCQAFSVAGLRQSLNDDRGNLTLEMVRILNAIDTIRRQDGKQPAILVWENVPGVLSTKDNALGCFLGAIAGEDIPIQPAGGKWTGAGFVSGQKRNIAWRTLDAQFFGVPQRRRRIFLVASAWEDISVAKILFEPQSLRRNTETFTKKEVDIAKTLTTRAGLRGNASVDTYIVVNGRQEPITSDIACPVDTQPNTNVLVEYEYLHVRRLTPLECERLQGFPDNHTRIPYRNKPANDCPDTPRYKAIGNSMAVPVMRWIGKRIKEENM